MQKKWIIFIALLWLHYASFAATLQSIEVRRAQGKTSLYFSLSEPVPHKVFTLVNPSRVVVDFENTHLKTDIAHLKVDKRYIQHVRSGQPYPGTLRLVFEVTPSVEPHSDNMQSTHRGFWLDFMSRQKQAPVHLTSTVSRPMIVVIDPGHGGKDPGAHGPHATNEKAVVLSIARRLQALINAQPNMKAILTRNGDYYLGLRQRLNVARRNHADIFIAIHADAFNNPHSTGASVFALSQSGATSEAARWLAEKENYSELGGVNLSHLDDKNGLVRTVLIDLSQTATISASLEMGERVLSQLNHVTNLHNVHVEQARFVVLKSPDIPSILIETGFISNPKEESHLKTPAYQAQLSRAIYAGLKQYFIDYPPKMHMVQQLSRSEVISYQVKRGDSLSNIAVRHHIAMSALRRFNHLKQDKVLIGQTLRIPA